jgi:hypothetical protein
LQKLVNSIGVEDSLTSAAPMIWIGQVEVGGPNIELTGDIKVRAPSLSRCLELTRIFAGSDRSDIGHESQIQPWVV